MEGERQKNKDSSDGMRKGIYLSQSIDYTSEGMSPNTIDTVSIGCCTTKHQRKEEITQRLQKLLQ